MNFNEIADLRARHPAWKLLRADNAALVLSFLQRGDTSRRRLDMKPRVGGAPASRQRSQGGQLASGDAIRARGGSSSTITQ